MRISKKFKKFIYTCNLMTSCIHAKKKDIEQYCVLLHEALLKLMARKAGMDKIKKYLQRSVPISYRQTIYPDYFCSILF